MSPLPLLADVPRRLLEVAGARLLDEPVIAVQGPRSVGKSTLLAAIAESLGAEVFDLDDLAVRDVVRRDPGSFVSGGTPVCIDEFQHVPGVLDAIKAELNRDLRAGRFVLTGSTRFDALPRAAQSLTGRLHLLTAWPLSQGEIDGTRENLVEALLEDPRSVATQSTSGSSKADYIDRVVAGGMPIALRRSSLAARQRWFDDYVRLVLDRDVAELSHLRQAHQLPDLLRRLAGQTAQVLNVAKAADGLGVSRTTAADYVTLLESVFLVHRLEAWGRTLRARAAGTPKLHVVDSGIAARLLRLTPDKLLRRDPASLSEFGHLLETFAVAELLKQVSWLDDIAGYGHWRTHDGDEVDLVIERGDGAVIAFEVKAAGRVPGDELRGLRKLREALGDAFIAGVALYTGARTYQHEDRLWVVPLDRLWQVIGSEAPA
ncbi:MAG: ATP-binding protein [Actinomycetota bacterium]|nr:ATP-binding protein [Actinomycetota bacterium]